MEDLIEELVLPFSIGYRLARKKLDGTTARWLLESWWPCRKLRRLRAKWRIWRNSRYRGTDEFHRSLDMDVWAMLQLTKTKQERYLEDLARRRERLHRRSCRMGRMTFHG